MFRCAIMCVRVCVCVCVRVRVHVRVCVCMSEYECVCLLIVKLLTDKLLNFFIEKISKQKYKKAKSVQVR